MIIIRLNGRLGNQMFQYALYHTLYRMGKNVKLDASDIRKYIDQESGSDIFSVFGLAQDVIDISERDIKSLDDRCENLVKKIIRKLLGRNRTWIYEAEDGQFDSSIYSHDKAYLDGYWQSEKYFEIYSDDLRKQYVFAKALSEESKEYLKIIETAKTSVSIHIRLGDYLDDVNQLLYGNICTEEYYDKAINYFRTKYSGCSFFVFSNDKEYIQKFAEQEDFVIVDCNDETSGWMDMYLMSRCQHQIIANSSFSWWAAWLNDYSRKEVIAPSKWINTKEMKDICPKEWIRLS